MAEMMTFIQVANPENGKAVAKSQKHAEDVCVGLAGAPPDPFISSVRAFMASANSCGG